MKFDNSKKTESFINQFQYMSEIESFVEPQVFYVSLHGLSIKFECFDSRFVNLIRKHLPQDMYSFNSDSEVQHRVCWFSSEQLGEKWDLGGDHHCSFTSSVIGKVVTQRDFATTSIDEKTHYLMSPVELDDGFFNFLRFIVPQLLVKDGKYIFHSSGVALGENSAILFLGHSGYGKSTICQKFPQERVTGDDMHLLYFKNDKLIMEPTHLGQQITAWSKIGNPHEVRKLYWLEKSPENNTPEVEVLDDSNKRLKIMGSVSGVFWDQLSVEEMKSLLDFSSHCARSVNFEILKTSLNCEVLNYVDNSI